MHVLSVGKSTLQGELNRLYGYEARCNVGNDDVEIRVVSSVYPAPPMSSPPPGYTVPPHPGGNRHQVTVPPLGGGNRTPLPTSQF